MRVVVRQAGAEPFADARGGHGHDAGVDFTDAALFGGSVLLFDDAHHLPGLVAHDAPVAGRVCESSTVRMASAPWAACTRVFKVSVRINGTSP